MPLLPFFDDPLGLERFEPRFEDRPGQAPDVVQVPRRSGLEDRGDPFLEGEPERFRPPLSATPDRQRPFAGGCSSLEELDCALALEEELAAIRWFDE